ncbi:hypothetical protein BAY59_27605 [Prauserella coralliicola]|nr:hypothetical protein BAY59_27605 [Prauserella coralliicola]
MFEAEPVEVRLIRHGETRGYEADLGLTDRGREQALIKGAELAKALRPGDTVRLLHAPTARAAETATALREGLLAADVVDVPAASVDGSFHNFRLWCDDVALDPTQAYASYAAVRDRDGERRPAWYAEIDRFFSIQAAGEDPITYWLTQPVQHFEPAAAAVRRFWHGIVAHVRDAAPGLRVFVATHSGCIRALAASAFGYDPGEPENTEDVVIRTSPAATHAQLTYRERTVELVVPTTATPPWVSPIHEGEPQDAHR